MAVAVAVAAAASVAVICSRGTGSKPQNCWFRFLGFPADGCLGTGLVH